MMRVHGKPGRSTLHLHIEGGRGTTAGAQDLVDALGVDDPADIKAVGDALARAFMQSTAAGATEMIA